jgi:hypothetical protein
MEEKSNLENQEYSISEGPALEVGMCLRVEDKPGGLGAEHTAGSCAEEGETWTFLVKIRNLFGL